MRAAKYNLKHLEQVEKLLANNVEPFRASNGEEAYKEFFKRIRMNLFLEGYRKYKLDGLYSTGRANYYFYQFERTSKNHESQIDTITVTIESLSFEIESPILDEFFSGIEFKSPSEAIIK